MEIAIVLVVTAIMLIAWAAFLGWHYQTEEDRKNLKDLEDYFAVAALGGLCIIAWPFTLSIAIIGGIMYGIAMLSRKIVRRKNGFSTRG